MESEEASCCWCSGYKILRRARERTSRVTSFSWERLCFRIFTHSHSIGNDNSINDSRILPFKHSSILPDLFTRTRRSVRANNLMTKESQLCFGTFLPFSFHKWWFHKWCLAELRQNSYPYWSKLRDIPFPCMLRFYEDSIAVVVNWVSRDSKVP